MGDFIRSIFSKFYDFLGDFIEYYLSPIICVGIVIFFIVLSNEKFFFPPPPPIDRTSPLDKAVVSVNNYSETKFIITYNGYKFVHNAQGNYRNLNIRAGFHYYPPSGESDFWYPPKFIEKYVEKWDSGDEIKFVVERDRIEKITLFIRGDFTVGDTFPKPFDFYKEWFFRKPFDKP